MTSQHCQHREPVANRREFLQHAGGGLGMLALAGLLNDERLLAAPGGADSPLAARQSHHAARAKSVIWLFMEGGPSGYDLFDPKPELQKKAGQRAAIDTFFGNPGPLLASPFKFKQYGEAGTWVSEVYPRLAEQSDKLALVKSCYAESNNHAPAMFHMNTGLTRQGFPSAGSWVTYGLGSENQNLPGFIVLGNRHGSKGGPQNWSNGFLPGAFQGTLFRAGPSPVLNLRRPADVAADDQRAQLDLLARWNAAHQVAHPDEADLLARIQSFELAWRMQSELGELTDLKSETEATRRLYGLDQSQARDFGGKCLLARRLVERGVRFVQVYCDDEWDAHANIQTNHASMAAQTDVGIAGLLVDLERRGLLDEVLVVWGGEFGRMPVSQGGQGRDHNPHGFLTWFAGAGIRAGSSYGATDEIGYRAVENRVSINDLHATMLHLLGLNHERLTYRHNGRDFRLTDVAGNVLHPLLA